MRIRKMFLTAILCSSFFFMNAQITKNTVTEPLDKVDVIVLKLYGDATIISSQSEDLKLKSFLLSKGEVWGWQFPNKRPKFEAKIRHSNDTLFVETPKIFRPKSIGINSYKESIETSIQIPMDKKILIKNADNLIIEGEFASTITNNTKTLNYLFMKKKHISTMLCEADNTLNVNGKNKGKHYEFNGTGEDNHILKAKEINIIIQ